MLSDLLQIFPACSVMHGHHEGITKVHFILTAASQMVRLIIVNSNAHSGSIKNPGLNGSSTKGDASVPTPGDAIVNRPGSGWFLHQGRRWHLAVSLTLLRS